MEGSSNSDEGFDRENVLVKSEIQPLNIDLILSSDADISSVASINDGCESPSSSSWDSVPETDIASVIDCHEGINLEEHYLDMEEQNQFVGVENTDDGLLWEMDNRSYDNLLKKFLEKEEELRVSNFRLQLSEQEIIKLNVQVVNREAQLDNVREELKLKEEELNKQKELSEEEIFKLKLSEEEIFKLKIQIDKSENQLDNVRKELKLKEEELKLKEKVLSKLKELSEEEIFKLKLQIDKNENQLDNVRKELKLKEEELSELKELSEEEIFKLTIQTKKTENWLDNVREELKLKEEEMNKQKVLLEEENLKLKIQIEKSEKQLENVGEELKLKKEELNKQKELSEEKIYELRLQIVKSKNRLDNVQEELNLKVEKLQGQLKAAQENMAKSELELLSNRNQIQMLGDSVIKYESKETNHEQEMQKLKSEMLDLQTKFSSEKDKLDFWTKKNMELTAKLVDCKSRNKELENKLSRDKDAKVEQEMVLKEEINSLREKLGQKMRLIEAAEKEMDMVVIERDDKLSNMNGYIKELKASLTEAAVICKTIWNEDKMLKLRVKELEEEVTRQNGVMSDKDEEKREAIRQLCYSLEHYRTNYCELVRAINKVYRRTLI